MMVEESTAFLVTEPAIRLRKRSRGLFLFSCPEGPARIIIGAVSEKSINIIDLCKENFYAGQKIIDCILFKLINFDNMLGMDATATREGEAVDDAR
jgi:hypothetical protein